MRTTAALLVAVVALVITGVARFVPVRTTTWVWLDAAFLCSAALCVALLVHAASRHLHNTFGSMWNERNHAPGDPCRPRPTGGPARDQDADPSE